MNDKMTSGPIRRTRTVPLLFVLAATLTAGEVQAGLILPKAISVSVPSGTNNPATGAYVDDVYLEALEFPDVIFATGSSFSPIRDFLVTAQRGNINAEWGDQDTFSDGDDNPFAKAGLDPADQESTNPLIQDKALTNAFNSLSLSEMSDGESGGFQFIALFQAGLKDDDPSMLDGIPELIFFERGRNDAFRVEVIVGGTFESPVYAGAFVDVDSRNFWPTGISVNTKEIGSAQEIGVAGIDLNDFGLGADDIAYGFRLSVLSGGPDLNGFFLSTEDPSSFLPPLGAPIPPSSLLTLIGLAGVAVTVRRRPLRNN